jgi:hypothetical protein
MDTATIGRLDRAGGSFLGQMNYWIHRPALEEGQRRLMLVETHAALREFQSV